MNKNDPPIIVEESINKSIDNVWKAITTQPQMVKWFFDNIPDFKAEVGFHTEFNVNTGERDFLHLWTITEVISNKKITYDWSYQGYEGKGFVTFELSEENNFTKVTLTNTIEESFQQGIPEFTRENCIGGWKYFLNNLKEYLGNV